MALATALAGLSGCCPIPMNDDVLVLPAATLVVRDASDRPVAGARILVHAEMQRQVREDDPTVEITTDAEGRATLVERLDEMKVYPLMMHGVPGFSWSVCIEHPAHGAMAGPRLHYENPNEIVVVLKGEKGKCEVAGSRATVVLEPTAKPPAPSETGNKSGPQGRDDKSNAPGSPTPAPPG